MTISQILQQATTALDLVKTLWRKIENESLQIKTTEEPAIYAKLQTFGLFAQTSITPSSSITLSYWVYILARINSQNIPSAIETLAHHLEEAAQQKANFRFGEIAAIVQNLNNIPPDQDITAIFCSITQMVQEKTRQEEWIDPCFTSTMINALKGKGPSSVDSLLTALTPHIEQNKLPDLDHVSRILEGLQPFAQLQSASNVIKILTAQLSNFTLSPWNAGPSIEKWFASAIYYLQAYLDSESEETQSIAVDFLQCAGKVLNIESKLRKIEDNTDLEEGSITLTKKDLTHQETREWLIVVIGKFISLDINGEIEAIDLTDYPCSIGLIEMIANFIHSREPGIQPEIYFKEEPPEDAWRYPQYREKEAHYNDDTQAKIRDIFAPAILSSSSSKSDSTSSDDDSGDSVEYHQPTSFTTSSSILDSTLLPPNIIV